MSLLNSASLCVTPNGYKAGTLYSVIPNTSLGDMTVVRATTATRVNSAGLIESMANNVPRLDYSNGSCPSLLVEPQRTNLALYSEQFTNAVWTASAFNVSITSNTTISPDGTQNADTVVFGASGYLYQQFAIVGLASVTFSIYSKSATQVIVFGGATPVGTDVYTTVNVGNGWFRQILVRTFTGGGTGTLQTLPFANNITAFLWGCQVEAGSYPTSYIPTTSAAVTRNADRVYKTGISSLIGQTQGTLFAEIVRTQSTATDSFWINISDNSSNNWIFMGTDATLGRFYVRASSTTIVDQYPTISLGRHKLAIGYQSGSIVGYVDGVQIFTSSATFTLNSLTGINFGYSGGLITGAVNTSGQVNQAVLFPTRLTNAELAQLTTL